MIKQEYHLALTPRPLCHEPFRAAMHPLTSIRPRVWCNYDKPQGKRGQDDVVIKVHLPEERPVRVIQMPSLDSQPRRCLKRPFFTALDACAAQDAAMNGSGRVPCSPDALHRSPSAANSSSRRDSLQADDAPPQAKKAKLQQAPLSSLAMSSALSALSAPDASSLSVLPPIKAPKKTTAKKPSAAPVAKKARSPRSSIASAYPAPSQTKISVTQHAKTIASKEPVWSIEELDKTQSAPFESSSAAKSEDHIAMIQMYRVRGTWYEVVGGEDEKWLKETKWVPDPASSTPALSRRISGTPEMIPSTRGETLNGRRKSTRLG